jgi:catechol 2,3-dioxygenase-like lactoylglutathione lyase family enzyme
MSRIQLALNVSDLNAAVEFYRKLFGTEPAKYRPGYANFAIIQPPLKLVLIENAAAAGTLNHLGIEVETVAEVTAELARLQQAGLETRSENQVTCCYALQDKLWVHGPDRAAWEIYTVLKDLAMPAQPPTEAEPQPFCQPACC